MGSHPFHSHRMHKKLQVSKSGRAAENWGFQRDMAGYYLNSSSVQILGSQPNHSHGQKKKKKKKLSITDFNERLASQHTNLSV